MMEPKQHHVIKPLILIFIGLVVGSILGFAYLGITSALDAPSPTPDARRCAQYNITPGWISAVNITYRMPDDDVDTREIYFLDRPRHTPNMTADEYVIVNFNTTERDITVVDAEYVHTHLGCLEWIASREEMEYGG